VEIIKKFVSLVVKYRKTAGVVVVGVVGALEAFGVTGLSESLSGLHSAICGAPTP